MRKLLGAGLGEIHAVIGAQPANLAFEIRALHRVASLLVDEAVPDIDIGDAGLFGARAIKLVEIAHIAGRFGAADRRQPNPEHRHAFALKRGDHVVDALFVKLGPFVGVKLVDSAGRPALRFGRGRRRLFAVRRWRIRRRQAARLAPLAAGPFAVC